MTYIQPNFRTVILLIISLTATTPGFTQNNWDKAIADVLPQTLKKHREFVSMPNVATNHEDMYKNLTWATKEFEKRAFAVRLLESTTLPVFLAEKHVSKKAKTVLFYLHLDGQAVNPDKWDQKDPFIPVLKEQGENGDWKAIDWANIDGNINPDWRIFGRAAADDKAPIMMMLTALDLLENEHTKLKYNIKIILDSQEEAGSEGFLSTLEQYKADYAADYMLIFDGPAHPTNKPTLTFGCRGIAQCNITVYGAKLPQHSGHYGNYAPNPVFTMSHLLASMKDETGRVTVDGYYDGIEITKEVAAVLQRVPDNDSVIRRGLVINKSDAVGNGYQESLQYPSLNVRHIETSWNGPGLKTVIPEITTAYLDLRLVVETAGVVLIDKIKKHIAHQGYLVLDRAPTDQERLAYPKIAKVVGNPGVNAFRTEMESEIGQKLVGLLAKQFGQEPIKVRTMGGTVPIIPAINTLDIPAVIVPLVNMDNNQHSPNENIRIGNISQGIKVCMVILTMDL
jgi:acetylornithine deacetylase/succinyl-diaminopimelate desuccinylase-like protein